MIVEYWLIFSTPESFFGRLLKKGFGHITLLTRDQFNWMVIDPLFNWVNIYIPPINVTDDLPHFYKENILPGCRIIYIRKNQEAKQYFFPRFGILSCVTLIKGIVGIKSLAITPCQLYRKLLKIRSHLKKYTSYIDIYEV